MKTNNMFEMLMAFSDLAEANQAEEIRSLATVFRGGKDEAVQARVKRVIKRWTADSERQAYPPSLKKSLAAIEAGLTASGVKTQVKDIATILWMFEGDDTSSVDSFVERINTALIAPPVRAPRTPRPKPVADLLLARKLADQLTGAALDSEAFSEVVSQLENSKLVGTPTLGAVANHFLGNSKAYRGRKTAIDEIKKRQKQDARFDARERAMDRIGV